VRARATEALTSDPRPARVVNLYIADSSGVASAALGAAVQQALDEYRAGGISVVISNSIPQIVDVQLHLTFVANTDTTVLTQVIRANVTEYINSLGVGETLYRAGIFSVLQRFASAGLIVSQDTVVIPTGDLVPGTGQTLRTRLENVVVA
jgi:phage-related baseplate assembly protein